MVMENFYAVYSWNDISSSCNSIISENNKYDEISWGIMSELNLS